MLAKEFIKPNLHFDNISTLVSSIGNITVDRSGTIRLVRELVNLNTQIRDIERLITAIGMITFDRQGAIRRAQAYMKPSMNESDLGFIISGIGKFENDSERDEAEAYAKEFIKPGMSGLDIRCIFDGIKGVAVDRMEAVFLTKEFIKPGMNGIDIGEIISAIGSITVDRKDIVSLTRVLIRSDMNGNDIKNMLSTVQKMAANRSNIVGRVLLFTRGVTGRYEYDQLRQQILETPLTRELRLGDMRDVAQGEDPYAAGINVHAKGRDLRAIAAVRTLQEKWYPEPQDIDDAYENFLRAVRNLDETRQRLVLRSLGIDRNGKILPKPTGEDFSGLIAGVSGNRTFALSSGGDRINVNGRELIARFWHFANSYIPDDVVLSNSSNSSSNSRYEAERAAMREGIMNALVEGVIPGLNFLRCEMGRVQLLELATVQGRLRGSDGKVVDVDDLGLNPNEEAAVIVPQVVANPVHAEALQVAPVIRNLNDIAYYLQPFIDSLGHDIQTAEQFYMRLFSYRNNLADGHVMARRERINLDPSEVMYFVRMMEPITLRGKITGYEINPERSLVAQLELGDAFRVDDYMRQFGDRDRMRLEAIRELEARRALIAQQDREHAEAEEQDRIQFAQRDAATTIQRVARGKIGRSQVAALRTEAEQKRAVEEQKHADETARPKTKEELAKIRVRQLQVMQLEQLNREGEIAAEQVRFAAEQQAIAQRLTAQKLEERQRRAAENAKNIENNMKKTNVFDGN